jgi:hypothetical protein
VAMSSIANAASFPISGPLTIHALRKLVGVAGFEPATPSSRTRCATRLPYTAPQRQPCNQRAGRAASAAVSTQAIRYQYGTIEVRAFLTRHLWIDFARSERT